MDHIQIPNDTLTGQLFLSSKESALDIKLLGIHQIKLVVSVCASESKHEKEWLHSQRIGYKWKRMVDKEEKEDGHMLDDEIMQAFQYVHSLVSKTRNQGRNVLVLICSLWFRGSTEQSLIPMETYFSSGCQ